MPVGHELPDRLAGVLRVVYLVFNEAHLSRHDRTPVRIELADEAIRLGRELDALMPDEPEVGGPLALMLLQHARPLPASTPTATWSSSNDTIARCGIMN